MFDKQIVFLLIEVKLLCLNK